MSDNKPTFTEFINDMKAVTIINQDIDLADYIRELEVYLARKGAGINDSGFQEINDYIDMLDHQEDNHPALVAQIETAQHLLAKCLPFILAIEKEEDALTTEQYNKWKAQR